MISPSFFLTASGDEYSTVTGFDLGADDYIPKPFRPRELLSRIKNVLRLTGSTGKTVKLGDVVVDTEKGTAMKDNKDLFLSALEYRLLLAFINNRGIVLTRERLLDSMWDVAGTYVNDNTLTVYIKRLRRRSRTTLPSRRSFRRFAGSDTRWTHDEAAEKQRGARRAAVAALSLPQLPVPVCFCFDLRAGLTAVVLSLLLMLIFCISTYKRYQRISSLADDINQVLHGDSSIDFDNYSEGELSILHSEIYKMTVRLREQQQSY